jgi:hypothetical protein
LPGAYRHGRPVANGRGAAQNAILGHADNIRRYFFEALTLAQAVAIQVWSRPVVDRVEQGMSIPPSSRGNNSYLHAGSRRGLVTHAR